MSTTRAGSSWPPRIAHALPTCSTTYRVRSPGRTAMATGCSGSATGTRRTSAARNWALGAVRADGAAVVEGALRGRRRRGGGGAGRRPGLRVGVVPRAAGDHQGDERKRGRAAWFGAWPPFSSAPARLCSPAGTDAARGWHCGQPGAPACSATLPHRGTAAGPAVGVPPNAPVVVAKRGAGGLHRLSDHGQQLGVERVQVDLVAQPDREGVEGAGGVVAAPVEAAVDHLLDAPPGRRNIAASARVAPATAQLGGWSPMPPKSWPATSTAPP